MVHNVNVVWSVANYGILFGRCESPVGRNVLYCMRRFNAVLSDILWRSCLEACYYGYLWWV